MLPRYQYDSIQKGVEGILEAVQEQRISLCCVCLFEYRLFYYQEKKRFQTPFMGQQLKKKKQKEKTADNKSCLSEILIVNFCRFLNIKFFYLVTKFRLKF